MVHPKSGVDRTKSQGRVEREWMHGHRSQDGPIEHRVVRAAEILDLEGARVQRVGEHRVLARHELAVNAKIHRHRATNRLGHLRDPSGTGVVRVQEDEPGVDLRQGVGSARRLGRTCSDGLGRLAIRCARTAVGDLLADDARVDQPKAHRGTVRHRGPISHGETRSTVDGRAVGAAVVADEEFVPANLHRGVTSGGALVLDGNVVATGSSDLQYTFELDLSGRATGQGRQDQSPLNGHGGELNDQALGSTRRRAWPVRMWVPPSTSSSSTKSWPAISKDPRQMPDGTPSWPARGPEKNSYQLEAGKRPPA